MDTEPVTPILNALDEDIDLLAQQDLIRGREALTETARQLAYLMDTDPTPLTAARLLDYYNALGIGALITAEPAEEKSDWDKLVEQMGNA